MITCVIFHWASLNKINKVLSIYSGSFTFSRQCICIYFFLFQSFIPWDTVSIFIIFPRSLWIICGVWLKKCISSKFKTYLHFLNGIQWSLLAGNNTFPVTCFLIWNSVCELILFLLFTAPISNLQSLSGSSERLQVSSLKIKVTRYYLTQRISRAHKVHSCHVLRFS